MAKKVYIVELDARNAAALKKIDEVEGRVLKSSGRMEKAMNRIGVALVAAFSAQQVLSFMKSSIDAFLESEKVARKLELQFGRNANTLQRYAKELQKVTVYEDDLIVQAMSTIGVFIKDEDVVKKLTKATLNLASAKGIDLLEAAELVTKTLVSDTNALKRQGFEIEGNAGSVERLNSLLGALAITTGYAEDEAKSYTGQLQQMNNELDTQQEIIGESLAGAWLGLNKVTAFSLKALVDAGKILGQYFRTGIMMPLPGEEIEKLELMKTYTSEMLRNETDITKEKKKQVETYDQLLTRLQKYSDYLKLRGIDADALLKGIGAPDLSKKQFEVSPIDDWTMSLLEWKKEGGLKEPIEEAENPMSALVSLSNQMASNFSFAGHTFVGQLSQAIAMVDSISNMILVVASMFGGGGGGFGLGGLLSLIGLEKGGRISNLGGNIIHTKIPSFAMGGSYTTPAYGGGYPVMVHKNETLDVYNAGQTSRMESKMDRLINAVLTTNLHVSKGGKNQSQPIIVNVDGQTLFKVNTRRNNRASRAGVNTGELI